MIPTMQITIQDVHKSFYRGDTEVRVLRGLSCEFTSGSFNFIVGPSGSGKSSLLYLIGALDQPSAGEIEIDGRAISSWSKAEANRFRAQDVGFIFQSFNLMSNLTALDNVLIPEMPKGVSAEKRKEAEELLKRVGLADRMTHRPSHLSGGEQQRVAIARALLKQPRLILADEPTGELDSETGKEVFSYLRLLAEQNSATVIVVTHDESYMQPQDQVYRIRDGKLLDQTQVESVK